MRNYTKTLLFSEYNYLWTKNIQRKTLNSMQNYSKCINCSFWKKKNEKLCSQPIRPIFTRARPAQRTPRWSTSEYTPSSGPAVRVFFFFSTFGPVAKTARVGAVRARPRVPGRNLGLGRDWTIPPGPNLAQRGGGRSEPLIQIRRPSKFFVGIKP